VTDPRGEIRTQLTKLVSEGESLHLREALANGSEDERRQFVQRMLTQRTAARSKEESAKSTGKAVTKAMADKVLPKPDFPAEYQHWYSPALRVVQQLLPDRYDEFRALYQDQRRKALDIQTFGISEYISGITVSHYGTPAFSSHDVAMIKLRQQVAILKTAEQRIDSLLTDIGRVLQSGLLDDESAVARSLAKEGYLRAGGAVAGVVLEAHLKQLLRDHSISLRKKAMLSNLNDALKDGGVYDVPRWREIQHLTDLRNLCAHKSDRDPTKDEVTDLIESVDRIIHTVF
jgi:hypothetical protein